VVEPLLDGMIAGFNSDHSPTGLLFFPLPICQYGATTGRNDAIALLRNAKAFNQKADWAMKVTAVFTVDFLAKAGCAGNRWAVPALDCVSRLVHTVEFTAAL